MKSIYPIQLNNAPRQTGIQTTGRIDGVVEIRDCKEAVQVTQRHQSFVESRSPQQTDWDHDGTAQDHHCPRTPWDH